MRYQKSRCVYIYIYIYIYAIPEVTWFIYIYIYIYIANPQYELDVTQGFNRFEISFSSSRPVVFFFFTKVKKNGLPHYLPIYGERRDECVSFAGVLTLWEMLISSSRIELWSIRPTILITPRVPLIYTVIPRHSKLIYWNFRIMGQDLPNKSVIHSSPPKLSYKL